jgi:MBG domain (YGX type)/Bacterial Ig-like domain (group 3)/Galactose oxidase, central domain
MLKGNRFSARASIVIWLAALMQFSVLQGASNTWSQAGTLSQAREGSAAVLLSNGRVLFTGGAAMSGALSTTELFNPDGSFSVGMPMLEARTHHTAVVLADGRVLVAGGVSTTGSPTNTAEIYDPSSNAWTPVAGGMRQARTGHTASLLKNGRVLVAGGESTSGATNTLEIFSPDTNTFAAVSSAALSSPRQQHAAAVLPDGRVLITGGSDGTHALVTADIFDPSSESVSSAGQMSSPRANLSATTLLDGTVLVAGGNDGSGDLVSTEIYDPASGAFSVAGNLANARSGHSAFLLPNNNEVLIAGGSSAGVPLAATELYVPWDRAFTSVGPLFTPRMAATGSALNQEGQLLFGGGTNGRTSLASTEIFRYATITTDASDYPPGTTVNISGSGWQPGETVSLTLAESPFYDTHGPYTAVADSNGRIFNNQFATDEHDANIRFYLTAKGSTSLAQMTFTDSNVVSVTVEAQSPTPVAPGDSATYLVTVGFSGNQQSSCSAALSVTGLPSGASYGFSNNPLLGNKGDNLSSTLTISLSVGTQTNSYALTVTATPQSGCQGSSVSAPITLVVKNPATTTLVSSSLNPSVYGQTVTFTATVTSAGGSGTPAGSVTFYDGGSCASPGSLLASAGTLNGSGVAIFSTSALSAGTHNVVACYSPTGGFSASSGSVSQQVGKAAPVITWPIPSAITYGTPLGSAQLNATASVPGSFSYIPAAGTVLTAGNQTLSVTFTPNDATNYTMTSTTVQLNVNQAPLTVTADNKSKSYGDANPTLTATYSGFVNGDTSAVVSGSPRLNTSATAASGVGVYPITAAQGTLTASNYSFRFVNGSLTINKAHLTVTADSQSRAYGDPNPSLTATLTGFKNSETLATSGVSGAANCTTTGSVLSAVAGSPYAITCTQGTLTAGNYDFNPFVDGTLTITARPITITADAQQKIYGAADPALTYKIASGSLVNSDALSGSLTRDAGENVGVYVIRQGTLALSSNYALTYVGANLIINKAPLTVKANDASMSYGGTLPTFSAAYSGFVNGDTASVLTGSASFTPTTAPTAAGTYPITPAQGTLVAANYTFIFINGTLTVNKAVLSAKADNQSKAYGAPLPGFTGSITGVVNGDGITATYATGATAASPVGGYPITVNLVDPNGRLSNYDVNITNGTLTVTPAVLTITPDSGKSKTYGVTFTAFTGTLTGLQGQIGDAVMVTYGSAGAPASASVGAYDITAATVTFTAGSASNYNIIKNTASNGLTVNPATLTITPDGGKSKLLGATFTAFTGAVSGLQNSDAVTVIYNSAGAPASASAGAYDITVATLTFTSGSGSNYNVVKNTATKGLTVYYNTCLLYDPTRAVKSGATYPIKLYLCDVNNADVSSPGLVVNATGLYQNSSFTGSVEDAGNANPDNNFRYDSTLGPSGGYIFNLSTRGLNTGTYRLTFTAGTAPNASYAAGFGVK